MTKKIVSILLTFMLIFSYCSFVFADYEPNYSTSSATTITNDKTNNENLNEQNLNKTFVKNRENQIRSLENYKDEYKSDTYAAVAYIFNKIRLISIPLCFLGIAICSLYQCIYGSRNIVKKQIGFKCMIFLIFLFIFCQILPLIFAIVIKGWRF